MVLLHQQSFLFENAHGQCLWYKNSQTLQQQPVLWYPLNWFQHVVLESKLSTARTILTNKITNIQTGLNKQLS